MKRILTILLTALSLTAFSQIQPAPPLLSKAYGTTTFIAPDGMLWYGTNPLKYRGVYPKTKVDSLLALIAPFDASLYYTKVASDARFYPLSTNPAGYLTSFTELDPTVPAYAKSLTAFSVIKTSTDALYPTLTGGNASGTWNINVLGNAETVTNGVYSTGSYANPSWITSLAYSKLTGVPDLSGYELLSNKSTDLTSPNNTKYPTTLAVSTALGLKANLDGGNSFTGYQNLSGAVLDVNATYLGYPKSRIGSAEIAVYSSANTLSALTATRLSFRNEALVQVHLEPPASPSSAWTYTLPNASGTIALTSDLSGYALIAGGNAFTGFQSITQGTDVYHFLPGELRMYNTGNNNTATLTTSAGLQLATNASGSPGILLTDNLTTQRQYQAPDIGGTILVLNTSSAAPATSTSTGKKGTVIITGGFRYECIDDNVWVRSAVEVSF